MHQSIIQPTQLQLPGGLLVRFDPDPVTSDAELPFIAVVDQRIGLNRRLAPLLPDHRNSDLVTQSTNDLLRSRVYGIVAGYEDTNDAAHLRGDPAFKLACGRTVSNPKADLASQCLGAGSFAIGGAKWLAVGDDNYPRPLSIRPSRTSSGVTMRRDRDAATIREGLWPGC